MTAVAKNLPLKRTLPKKKGFGQTSERSLADQLLFRDCAWAVRHFRPCIRVNIVWGLSKGTTQWVNAYSKRHINTRHRLSLLLLTAPPFSKPSQAKLHKNGIISSILKSRK